MSDVTMRNRPDDGTTHEITGDATWLRGNDEHDELAKYDVDSVTRRDDDDDDDDDGDAKVPPRTTEKTLRQVQRELCLIRLCWPEVPPPTTETLYARSLPDVYRRVNDKERLLLWYAENFRRQFHARYTDRRPLLLACENECGVQKFVSTTIRRCTPQYPELYMWQGCASFISDYICYEAPDEAFLMPRHLRSPTWVMNFRKGNSFEYATLLVGLLLGQSYNAVVVSGYASREQILCDLSKKPCPYLSEPEEQIISLPSLLPSTNISKNVKYQLTSPPDFRSQLLLELEERRISKMTAELRLREEERHKIIADSERPRPDKYFGHRIHAWVAILPEDKGIRSEEIIEPIFIEPSSGISYRLSDDETNLLYLGVESVWNDKNYWVNMQPRTNGCTGIDWDLSKTHLWEHLLPGELWTAPKDTDMVEEDIIEQNKHLDMPASYVNEIQICNIDYEKRYPNGNKTIFYKKAKVELFAPYIRSDGLVRQVTVYEDYQYTTPVRCYEKYLNRNDCLVESTRDFDTGTITDSFEKGRSDHCKAHRYVAYSKDVIDSERVIDFYDSAHFDGLSRIEMDSLYLTQHYVNREDFLYYSMPRMIEFLCMLQKIVEKYHRNEKISAYKDIAIREFIMIENEIRIKFHYNESQSTRATRTFVKPSIADRGDRLVFDSSMTHGYHPDPTAPPEKTVDLFYALDKHLKDEDYSVSRIRDAESDVALFLKRRADENLNLQLTVSLYHRDQAVDIGAKELRTEEPRYLNQKDLARELDPLGPYLAQIGNPSSISKAGAYLLLDECLNNFKRSSIEKANRILFAIQERAAELEKLQTSLTQIPELLKEEEEQILVKINEVGFDLYLLETYLNRHKESTSTRYRVLVDRLQENPHLQSLDTKH